MTMGRTHVILAAVPENRIYGDGILTGLVFPQNYVEWTVDGTEVTWTINVRGATGDPTSWSLEARFLDIVEHTSGPQYSEPQTVPFTELQTRTYVEEGVAWGKADAAIDTLGKNAGAFAVIADNSQGLGGAVSTTITRTVRCFNRRHKLELRPTFAGGTTPGLVVALTAQVH